MDLEEFIRDRAKLGWSREMTRKALGISSFKFRAIVAALPDVEWPALNKSVARQEFYDSQRGYCSPKRREALEKSWASKRANGRHFQIGSTYEITSVQLRDWAEYITVTQSQISRRLARGWSVYDAFFLPAQPKFANKSGWKDAKCRLDSSNHEKDAVGRRSAEATRAFILALRNSNKPQPDQEAHG